MKINSQYTHNATKRVAVIELLTRRRPKGHTVTFRYIGDMHSLKAARSAFEKSHTLCPKK